MKTFSELSLSAPLKSNLAKHGFAQPTPVQAQSIPPALARELAMQAEWISEESDRATPRWCLRVERESLRAPALRDKLQGAVVAAQGRAIELELVDGVALDSPALRDAAARASAQQQAEQTMTADPVVRELMAQFKTARIVPGSIKPVQRNTSP